MKVYRGNWRWFFRRFWLPAYRWWALRHIRREQVFRYGSLRLTIPAGVFHPGVFFSTPVFLDFLDTINFQHKKVLDVGTGSGALALLAARRGAVVTALDINLLALEAARQNAAVNRLPAQFVHSDLFDALPPQHFDLLLINPPYYARTPGNNAERAFFAGEGLEYFEKLFRQLPGFLHSSSQVYMILSEDCDLKKIQELAGLNRLSLRCILERKKWGERQLIFEITSAAITFLKL